MASQSIDQKSDSRALPTLARTGLCLFGDELRRVGAFGTSAVLLLGMACGVAVIHAEAVPLRLFSRLLLPRQRIQRLQDWCALIDERIRLLLPATDFAL